MTWMSPARLRALFATTSIAALAAVMVAPAAAGTAAPPPEAATTDGATGNKRAQTRASYVVRFAGPIAANQRQRLIAVGGEILDYLPGFAFKARLTPTQAHRIREQDGVVSVELLPAEAKLSPALIRDGKRLYRLRLERNTNAEAAARAIAGAGAEIVIRTGNVVVISADANALDGVAALADVSWIENFQFRERRNEYGGGQIIGSAAANTSGFDGSSVTVAVADTGLGGGTAATAHRDLPSSRIGAIFDRTTASNSCYTVTANGAKDEDSGHGTHVALSAVGGGGPSGEGRGTAPGAQLVFQAVEEYLQMRNICKLLYPNGYYLIGIPEDIRQLFQQAYDAGARIHANSWGIDDNGAYSIDSVNLDDFVWNNPQLTITFAAGNAGIDGNGDGIVDPGSVGSPATAKNAIAIGASENDRVGDYACDGGLAYSNCAQQGGQNVIATYGQSWPTDYPAEPLFGDPAAGHDDQMAAFSSRGPTDDGRIKPDVVAPGTWVLSGYSDLHQQGYDTTTNLAGRSQDDGWGFPYDGYYKYFGGTSMANPLAGGAAAVVRDFYQKVHSHQASAALVKATLINSAVDLADENNDGAADNAFPIPNIHEGWGLIDLVGATDDARAYVDQSTGIATAATAPFAFDVADGSGPLKVSLVWSDYPGTEAAAANLVNDLDLLVTSPGGAQYRGNVFSGGWSLTGGAPDRINNVENVYIQTPEAGTWTVQVTGFNVPQGPQPFALVVAGGTPAAVGEATLHIADLDGSAAITRRTWRATVTATVRDNSGALVSGATVNGSWSGGVSAPGSCVSGANGQCAVTVKRIPGQAASVTFTVNGISHGTLAYAPGDNADPDGDSNGTVITVAKP